MIKFRPEIARLPAGNLSAMKLLLSNLFSIVFFLTSGYAIFADEPAEGYIVTPDKVKIFYKIEGKGSETLVVVHGGPGNSLESVRPDFEPLAKNRRVIYYDQRGQGRSELVKDGKKLGYKNYVADLEALREHFKLEKMNLIGNSWGGLLASLYATAHPDRIERLILDSPAPPTQALLGEMEDVIRERMEKKYKPHEVEHNYSLRDPDMWLKAKDPVAVCRDLYMTLLAVYMYSQTLEGNFKGDVCFGGPESVRLQPVTRNHVWQSLGNYNLVPKLGSVKAPVLVIHGMGDVIPLKSSEAWASGYPNARLFVIEKAGHMAQTEAPEVFFPAIETFLKGSLPADATKVQNRGN
jgi:proline iminopeptidase